MSQRGTAVGAVVLSVFGVSYLARQDTGIRSPALDKEKSSETRVAGHAAAKDAAAKDAAAKKSAIASACRQIAKHLTRFYTAAVPMPAYCSSEEPGSSQTARLDFIVAFVPNPVETHLPLSFDRSIEAIQQAAQDENYAYDSSWFPWKAPRDFQLRIDREDEEDWIGEQQKQPGILVFRRGLDEAAVERANDSYRDDALVVFVVAEMPTAGIDDTEFQNALLWMRALLPPQHTPPPQLRILGPQFSGSVPSLAHKLQETNAFRDFANQGMRIFSGGISSETSTHWFQRFLHKQSPGFTFSTFYESDSLMIQRFECYMAHEGYKTNRIAILSEDETAFGTQSNAQGKNSNSLTSGSCDLTRDDSPIYLYYPRDIATLRSAYEKQSIFTAGKQQAASQTTMLRGDLSEPDSSDHDSVRTYAGQLTPLAQEAALFGITNILNSKHIEFVILRSSNSLDQLFLSEFLRRSYPSGRIVLDGSDLLFRRGMEGASLRGVLLLSSYPLLSWTQDSIPKLFAKASHSYRVFGLDSTEGVYIAARSLLQRDPSKYKESVPASDYATPFWARDSAHPNAQKHPATWVTVVGHRQFWPLAVLNEATQTYALGDHSSLLDALEPKEESQPKQMQWLPGEMAGLLALCLLLGAGHCYCCWNGSIRDYPRVRAYFTPMPDSQHFALILISSVAVAYLGALVANVSRLGADVTGTLAGALLLIAILGLMVLGSFGGAAVYGLKPSRNFLQRGPSWSNRFWLIVLIVILSGSLGLLHWFLFDPQFDRSNTVPVFWRAIHLRSGVSPLLPEILLVLGFYAWAWFNLQGMALFGADRPKLPPKTVLPTMTIPERCSDKSVDEEPFAVFPMFSQDIAGKSIEAVSLPLNADYLRSLFVFALITVVTCSMALGEFGFRTLGDRRFGAWIFAGVCLCITLILAETLQFLRTWSRLRQLLSFLDRLRLRRTLAAMNGISWKSVWNMSGNVLEHRYSLISRQFESMRHLQNLMTASGGSTGLPGGLQRMTQNLAHTECAGLRFAKWYVSLHDGQKGTVSASLKDIEEFQLRLADSAGQVMTEFIRPEWSKETESLLLKKKEDCCCKDKDHHKEESAGEARPAGLLTAAEEFFALPYIGFIQNTIGRLRSIALSIVALFVAATFAVASYPFDPLPTIAVIFLTLFVLVAAAVISVYADMHRNTTLSYLTSTQPGELGLEFWTRLFTFAIGPLVGLLATLFPSVTDFIVSWLQPGAEAVR